MMQRMEPQHRICLISSYPLVKVFTSSRESISACLPFIGTDFLTTDLAENVICDTLPPAIPSFLRLTWKAFWPLTLLVCPGIRPSQLLFKSHSSFLHNFESDPSALIIFSLFWSHSLCQLSPWCMGNEKWNMVATFGKPRFLLDVLLLLSQVFLPRSWCVNRPSPTLLHLLHLLISGHSWLDDLETISFIISF